MNQTNSRLPGKILDPLVGKTRLPGSKNARRLVLTIVIAGVFISGSRSPANLAGMVHPQGSSQPSGIILNENGVSTIGEVLDSSGWTQTAGPGDGDHVGDDSYAIDLARDCGQTAGQNLYAGISGTIHLKFYGDTVAYGKSLVIYDSATKFALRYAHMSEYAPNMTEGARVDAGEYIGKVGNTGNVATSTGCTIDPGAHLHLVLYKGVTSTAARPIDSTTTTSNPDDKTYAAEFTRLSFRIPPAAPLNLRTNAASSSEIFVSWDYDHNSDGFALERSNGLGGTYVWIANIDKNQRSYTTSSLSSGATYCYRVKAYRGIVDSPYSAESCAKTLAPSPSPTPSPSSTPSPSPTPSPAPSPSPAVSPAPPNAPRNVAARALSSTRVQITWEYDWSKRDHADQIEVQRQNPDGVWHLVSWSFKRDGNQIVNPDLQPGTSYKFEARATWGINPYSPTSASDYVESNFVTTPSCAYSLSAIGATNFGVNGGTGTVTVGAPSQCDWRAGSNDPAWISISPDSGTGTRTLEYWVVANISPQVRSGSFSIADQTVQISQAGRNTFSVSQFSPSPSYNVYSGQWFTGDFNGDGKIDLIHLTNSDYVHPWLSRGDGTFDVGMFRPWAGYIIQSGKWLTGDFNGDHKTDLVHIVDADYVNVWLSNGDGSFNIKVYQARPGYNNRSGTWLTGDLNGDGRTDLIHLPNATYIHPWISKGDGTFDVKQFQPWGGYAVYIGQWLAGDFNGDGRTDLIHLIDDYAHPWLSNGDGTFAVSKFSPWPGYSTRMGRWFTGDFNGDGATDLIHVTGSDYVRPWLSTGNGAFAVGFFGPATGYQTNLGRWLVGDLDADGRTDLVHIVGGDYVHPWLSKGDGTFAVSRFSPTPGYNGGSGWWVTADLNGDKKTDLVHLVESNYVHAWISGADQTTYSYASADPSISPCPGCPIEPNVKVWANTSTGRYHCAGTRFYGRTKRGGYLTQKQAQDIGYRAAYGRICH